MSEYMIMTDSTVDLPKEYLTEELGVPYIPLTYLIDGQSYEDMIGLTGEEFFAKVRAGSMPTTSQINPEQAREALEPYLKEGKDILYIAFSSGLSGTYNSIRMAAEELQEEYPERKLIVIDSLCSSSGYGLLVDGAADLRDEGKSMDEITDWVLEKRKKVHHQFYSTELKFYRRSGRMSGAAAAIGTVLGICPIMRLDDKGRIIAYDKVRGKKNAVARTVETMKRHAENGENYSGKAFICHSNCLADAKATKAAVEAAFPHLNGEVRICDIGTIVASHSGPGTVAVFFFGDDRAPEGSPV
mgnify:CR=1 FL=1